MRKWIKPGRRYFIINIDEPYAEEIFKVLKRGQMKKGQWPEGNISFEEWKKLTWPDEKPGSKEDTDFFRESKGSRERDEPQMPIKKTGRVKIKVRGIGRV